MPNVSAARSCSIDGCESKFNAKGFCKKHYARFSKHGDPLGIAHRVNRTPQQRLDEKTELIPFSDCWWWTGSCSSDGYGGIGYHGKVWKTHRLSYKLNIGEIAEGMCVLHTCDEPSCIRPSHLFLGTNQDNINDKVSKGRQYAAKGELNPISILTSVDVLDIRKLKGTYTQEKIGKIYGVDRTTISKIHTRVNWGHI